MILSYRARRYGNLDTLNSKIRPLQQILEIDGGKSEEEQQQQEEDPIIIEEDLKTIIYFQGLCQILFIGRDFFQGLCQFLLLAETVSFFQDYFFIGRDYFLFFRVSANYFFCEETVSANFIFFRRDSLPISSTIFLRGGWWGWVQKLLSRTEPTTECSPQSVCCM